MIKTFLIVLLLSTTSIFSKNIPTPPIDEKLIINLQKYCTKHPNLWQGFYNLGCAHYQLNDFESAKKNFSTSLQKCTDPNQQESIFYNLGNSYFKQFQNVTKEQQIPVLEKCIQNYESSLALNPNAKDTKKNLDIAKKLLEKLKEQQKHPQNQDKNQDKNPQTNQNDKDKNDEKNKDSNPNNQQQNNQNDSKSDNSKKPDDKNDQNGQQSDKNDDLKDKQISQSSQNVPQSLSSQDRKKQELENILQKEKNNERILPINFSKHQKNFQDKTLKDW